MNVTLRQIQAFDLVARLESFTRAAQAMHLTQSALSVLIRELESAMQTRLLDRTTRSVHLIAVGREFHASAQRLLGDLDHALANVDSLMAKQRGRVVVAAPLVLSGTLLPRILAGFQAAYPAVEVVLRDSLPADVLPQVRAGTADLGIGTFPGAQEAMHRILLFKESMVAAFPAQHPFTKQARLTWRQLSREPILLLRHGSVFRDLSEAGLAASGLALAPTFEADYVGTLMGLAEAGLGVAVVPGYATSLVDARRIRWRRLQQPVVEREVALIYRKGLTLSPAAQAFADFITRQDLQGSTSAA